MDNPESPQNPSFLALALVALWLAAPFAAAEIEDSDVRLHTLSALTLLQGDTLTAGASITNTGPSGVDRFEVPFFLFKQLDPSTIISPQVGTGMIDQLRDGDSFQFTTDITIPGDQPPTGYFLGYQIPDPPGDDRWIFFDTEITVSKRRVIDLKERAAGDQFVNQDRSTYNPGNNFIAGTKITNAGMDDSQGFSVEWRLSTDTTIGDADDIVLGGLAPGTIVPSGNSLAVTVSRPVTLPSDLTPGAYRLGMLIHSDIDSDQTNNDILFTKIINVETPTPAGPDLTFADTPFHGFYPGEIYRGTHLYTSFQVANIGPVNAGTYSIEYRAIETTALFFSTGIPIGTATASGVPALSNPTLGNGRTVTQTLIQTGDLIPGKDYYISVEITSAEDVDNSNNLYVFPTPFHVIQLASDLEVLDDWEVVPHDTVNGAIRRDRNNCLRVRGTIRNNGPGPAPESHFQIQLRRNGNFNNVLRNYEYRPQVCVITACFNEPLPGFVPPTYVPPLAAGESVYIDTTFKLGDLRTDFLVEEDAFTAAINDGVFTVRIRADSGTTVDFLGIQTDDTGNNIIETDETNNEFRIPGTIRIVDSFGLPDLHGFATPSVDAAYPGQTITMTGRVSNSRSPGSGQIAIFGPAGPTVVKFFLDNIQIGSDVNIPGMQLSQDFSFSQELDLPTNIAWGTYKLRYEIDANDDSTEAIECNNTGERDFYIGALPDLFEDANTPVELSQTVVLPNGPLTITGGVRNFGLVNADPSVVRASLSDDQQLGGDSSIGFARVGTILDFSTVGFRIDGRAREDIEPGYYWLLLEFDAWDEVIETNEENNVHIAGRVYVGGRADLTSGSVESQFLTATAAPGDTISFRYSTLNAGSVAATPHADAFFLVPSLEFSSFPELVIGRDVRGSAIVPGQDVTDTVSLTLPDNLQDGDYFIMVLRDDLDSVFEPNENNNVDFSVNTISVTSPAPSFDPKIVVFDRYEEGEDEPIARLLFTTSKFWRYQVETTTSLNLGWQEIGDPVQGTSEGLLEWRMPLDPDDPDQFFRVKQLP